MASSVNPSAGRTHGDNHYDPSQPRVPAGDPSGHGGQWTEVGGAGLAGANASAGAAAAGARAAAPFTANWVPVLRELLRGAPAGALVFGPLAFLRALLVSTPAGTVSEGRLPNRPDVRYRYDEGSLTLYLRTDDDEWPLIFRGRADADGLFRLPGGAVIGRDLGTGILLNEAAANEEERRKRALAHAVAMGRAIDEAKLCPAETPERPTNKKIEWRVYQYQVTGTTPGMAVVIGAVEFDGCKDKPERLTQDAKAMGYATKGKLKTGEFPPWYRGAISLARQMGRQSVAAAADGRIAVWIAAEEPMARWLERLSSLLGLVNVRVEHQPYVEPDQGTLDKIRRALDLAR